MRRIKIFACLLLSAAVLAAAFFNRLKQEGRWAADSPEGLSVARVNAFIAGANRAEVRAFEFDRSETPRDGSSRLPTQFERYHKDLQELVAIHCANDCWKSLGGGMSRPPTFDPQTEFDYLILSHMHRDAYGGFKEHVLDREFVFGMPAAISREIPDEGPWEKQILRMNEKNDFGDLQVTPFKVVHDIAYSYPTYGYQIEFKDGYKLTYASDMVGVPKNAERYFNNIDMLIADGAGWKSNLATHYGVFPFLDLVERKKWKIGRIYFTQIGRPVPRHAEANREISRKNPDASLAYDGMTVQI